LRAWFLLRSGGPAPVQSPPVAESLDLIEVAGSVVHGLRGSFRATFNGYRRRGNPCGCPSRFGQVQDLPLRVDGGHDYRESRAGVTACANPSAQQHDIPQLGKFRYANGPNSSLAARSYARAASTSLVKCPSQKLLPSR